MKEHDIRPADLFEEYLRLSAADVAAYFLDGKAREFRPCPGCRSEDHRPAFDKNGFSFVRCNTCATLFVTPAPASENLSKFYRESPSQRFWANDFFPRVAEARREKIFRLRAEKIRDLLAGHDVTPERVIDVGAGTGLMLEELRHAGMEAEFVAVEPSAELALTCRDKGFPTFEGFAADAAKDGKWAASASLVTSFEVIEHVLSPETFVRDLAALTRPGGLILFTGLSGSGFDILVLGEKSDAVSPPHHLNFISRVGVRALLERCALEEVEFLTPGQLDVDIVLNKLSADPDIIADPFLRHMLLDGDEETLDAFQRFLADQKLSSHMWVVARKPG